MLRLLAPLIPVLISSSALAGGSGCIKQTDGSKCTPPPFSSGYPTVINGDGRVIGKAMDIGVHQAYEGQFMYADVRLEYDGHGYVLRFYGDNRIGVGIQGLNNADGYWTLPGCSGYPEFIGQRTTNPRKSLIRSGLEPFISSYFTVIDVYNRSSENLRDFDEVSPFLAHLEPFPFGTINLYGYAYDVSLGGKTCQEVGLSSSVYTLYHLSETVDIKSQFSAPITFVAD